MSHISTSQYILPGTRPTVQRDRRGHRLAHLREVDKVCVCVCVCVREGERERGGIDFRFVIEPVMGVHESCIDGACMTRLSTKFVPEEVNRAIGVNGALVDSGK